MTVFATRAVLIFLAALSLLIASFAYGWPTVLLIGLFFVLVVAAAWGQVE